MFRGERPAGQPASLRQIAESNNAAGFEGAVPYVPESGLPASAPSAEQRHHDAVAEARLSPAGVRSGVADPRPFQVRQ